MCILRREEKDMKASVPVRASPPVVVVVAFLGNHFNVARRTRLGGC